MGPHTQQVLLGGLTFPGLPWSLQPKLLKSLIKT